MDKLNENYRDLKTQYFSLGDILAIGLMIATGLYFIITSALKISDLLFFNMNSFDLLLNIMGAAAGFGLIYGAYRFVTKSNYLKSIVDDLFIEALYDRLDPLLSEIAQISGSYDELSERVEDLNYNVNDIRKTIEGGKRQPENDLIPLQYVFRNITHQFNYIMMTTVTLTIYLFMFNNPSALLPYLSPIVFVLWWGLITTHSNLWEETRAWYWIAIPILIVPMFSVIFAALSTTNTMLLLMYFGLAVYILLYYVWCERTTRGIIPFGIGERIQNIKNILRSEGQEQKKEPEKKLNIFQPYHIGIILTILSIIIFAISMIGYLIQTKILQVSWQTFGLDIVWQSQYSYGLIGLGTVLLIAGYFFVIKFRRRE
ncbi:MAG: hypothetical protein C3F06_00095 [Candidatus Methanoperedenaceae archaeon]|nr:MAG: hypothetical protein C3F06_00095 [Candidatus Methanoperedenaceae archaeon]